MAPRITGEQTMAPKRLFSVTALLGILGLVSALVADPPKKEPANPDDKEVVESKPVKQTPAATVNFRKQLNLPFKTLATLGARIDAARHAQDPVALAHAASELAVSEKISEKKANLTSSAVFAEAAELARLRRQAAELQALLAVSNQVTTEQDNIASMRRQLDLARQQAKADTEAYQQTQEPTWTPRTLVVNNYTPQYLDITVNGVLKGQVEPGMTQVFTIEHRWNPTIIKAYGNMDIDVWGPRTIWGRFKKYTWNING
jgi:hypothetical protein